MSTTLSLPKVIGPTENALRAVLVKILSTTRIKTYPSWAILNAVCDADATASSGNWQSAVADALKVDMGEVDEVLSQLRAACLVGNNGSLTALGATELATGRSAVSAATSHLVDEITEKEQTTARLVLDHLRRKAEELLRL